MSFIRSCARYKNHNAAFCVNILRDIKAARVISNLFDRRSAHAQASGSIIERNRKVGLKSREVENNGRHLIMEEICACVYQ